MYWSSIEYTPPGGILPMGGLGGGGPLIGTPIAPPGGPGIELGTETGGACCGGPPVKYTYVEVNTWKLDYKTFFL